MYCSEAHAAEFLVLAVPQPHLHLFFDLQNRDRGRPVRRCSSRLRLSGHADLFDREYKGFRQEEIRGELESYVKRSDVTQPCREIVPPLPVRTEKDYSDYALEFQTNTKHLGSKRRLYALRKFVITIQENNTGVRSDLALFVPYSIRT